MATVATTVTTRAELAARLSHLQQLGQTGDQHLDKLALLTDKLDQDRCIVAICGHFSSGKSTLLNRLAGAEVLPSSPIPTSANRVLIRHGNPGATVRFRVQGEIELSSGDLDRIPSLCVDGDAVESIELRHPLEHVPEGIWLMDTPGIDSTDDAHRVATESALYLADAVFYVMDYNHVQSELNFQFTRLLTEWGKPLYLIVNQVDKHLEHELPFHQFQQSVVDAFSGWGVLPQAIFFTSLREPTHPLNQWDDLLRTLSHLASHRDDLLLAGVWHSAHRMMEEQGVLRAAELAPRRELLVTAVGAAHDSLDRAAALESKVRELEQIALTVTQETQREIGSLLANAQLFPHTTRELVISYLQSRKPSFKVGLFFAAAKTQTEIAARHAALHADFVGRVNANLVWLLRNLLLRIADRYGVVDESFRKGAQGFSLAMDPDLLARSVKEGALSGDTYPFNYMRSVSEEIQILCRAAILPMVTNLATLAGNLAEQEAALLRSELATLADAVAASQELSQMDQAAAAFQQTWAAVLGDAPAVNLEEVPLVVEQSKVAGATEQLTPTLDTTIPVPLAKTHENTLRTGAARQLRQAASILLPFPGMARWAADLVERADRLEQSRFTVALFGAFSSGKSSFANALLGTHLLPVSPNPTTAVINRILPPEADRPHGYVHVTWKDQATLVNEVKEALAALGLASTGQITADLAAGAARLREDLPPSAKPHGAFLAAAARGYNAAKATLGSEEGVGLDRFAALVANEEQSCFVQDIAVYVNSPLTNQGITLVDTPGADSINARHTGVAFDYIKNADAILFVTYYNHAFAQADREFLLQLGRVKDSFALDKMFFVINAADLAQSDDELAAVVNHVRVNLQTCGIRQARIFPVSSQTALWSRMWQSGHLPLDLQNRLRHRLGDDASPQAGLVSSGMERFEHSFYQFTVTELSEMAVRAAFAEVDRAGHTLLQWATAAKADASVRAQRLVDLQAAEAQALQLVARLDPQPEANSLQQTIDELLYYVGKRVLERFSEGFGLAFSPSALRSESGDMKRALQVALNEVIQFVIFDLGQEMRATALRVENALNKHRMHLLQKVSADVNRALPDWSTPAFTPVHLGVPTFADGREHLSPDPFRKLLGLYRNPEHFFGGGGRTQLRDELGLAIGGPVNAYLAQAREVLLQWYGPALIMQTERLKQEVHSSVIEHRHGLSAALSGGGDLAGLERDYRRLKDLARVPQ